ncbi:MAG TPA: pyruvate dehydrogenase (acetyl-transferring), homodimeric type, partial [Rhodocyclaceae bacterium]|nr:pyruvate dehydrogenase (acetyl-transferring), homodimeric type [Rhodocyclaceae bacterium]
MIDPDPAETQEWLDAIESVLTTEGPQRAVYLLDKVLNKARRWGAHPPVGVSTAYANTIPIAQEERSPGNQELEHRIRSYVRWNALAMVIHANRHSSELGGHIASFASSATLYDVGFNHFFH